MNEAARLVDVPIGFIRLLDGGTLVVAAATKTGVSFVADLPQTLRMGEGMNLSGHILATKTPLHGDAAAERLSPAVRESREGALSTRYIALSQRYITSRAITGVSWSMFPECQKPSARVSGFG